MVLDRLTLRKIVERALEEDLGSGDLTSGNIFSSAHRSKARITAKEKTVLCGLPAAAEVFRQLSPEIVFQPAAQDGDHLNPGTTVVYLEGPTGLLLTGERTALNFIQRLSGIAGLTAHYVEQVRDFSVRIVDTRKTTPGLRVLEKYAVRVGGGVNHRMGLFDAVMIKDNHVKAAGGIGSAVAMVKNRIPFLTPVEVEVSTVPEALEAVQAGADVIMLDNMSTEEMIQAVKVIGGRALVEASGGITLERLREIAGTGVDIISVGALTHGAPAVDFSMKIIEVI